MASQELMPGQNWTSCITPNDGTQDGSTVCSNSLLVLNNISLTSFYPNATGGLQNITNQINVSINTNTSATTNLTFNITATESYPEALTFSWFINNVLKFVQTLTSGFTSMFSQLFSTSGLYNVSVTVNGSNSANNQTFSFYLNLTSQPPFIVNSVVLLNSTSGNNLTTDNLTVSWNSTSYTSNLINITDWRISGTSIAVLNMPFEGGSNSTWTRDYSTYGNNGTVMNATWNSTDGYNGFGDYQFNGISSFVNASLPSAISVYTLSVWAKPTSIVVGAAIINNGTATNSWLQEGGSGAWQFDSAANGAYAATPGVWTYLAAVQNATTQLLYVNGVLVANATSTSSMSIAYIGKRGDGVYFNGSIDNVLIFNRTLSPQEIKDIYQNQSYIMDSSMLQPNQNWTSCITPNDGTQDGSTVCSNSLLVLNNISLTSFYPNATGGLQNITNQINVSISTNISASTNLTFNITATELYPEALTFNWFINNILTFVQTLTSGFTSMFSQLFSTGSQYTVSVVVNGSNPANNKTFTFFVNATRQLPFIVGNVLLNSTFGTNTSSENLTLSWNSTSPGGYTVINITDWKLNGTSIAVLNMPFEGGSNSTWTRDYSTYGNNGTVINATWNSTGGYNGFGDYQFNGNNSYIWSNTTASEVVYNLSLVAWFKTSNSGSILGFTNGLPTGGTHDKELYIQAGHITMYLYPQGGITDSTDAYNDSKWHFLVGTWNTNGTAQIWVDGSQRTSSSMSAGNTQGYAGDFTIGIASQLPTYFNGSIDNVMIFNRTLSAQEILNIYNNQSYIMDSSMLKKGQNWTACITPNDGTQDGSTVCSNNLVVLNSAPTAPVLVLPSNGNSSLTAIQPLLLWNASSDADGDTLTYNINLTSQFCANQFFTGVSATNYTTPVLSTNDKCGVYFWNVEANDGTLNSSFSSTFNFSIQVNVNINLTQNFSNFGNMIPGQTNTTVNNNPPPFIVQSLSNVLVNVSINATTLFNLSGLGNTTFMFKANTTNSSNTFNAFNTTYSNMTWTPMTSTPKSVIAYLNFPPYNNTAAIDLNVTVPNGEPPGLKVSTITVYGVES